MAQTTGANLPPPQTPFVDPSLNLSYDGYQYLLSVLSAAATDTATADVADNLTATGANQATSLQLTSDWNVVTAGASPNGVLLQARQAGQTQTVLNRTGNTISVYPPPGAAIDGTVVNTAFALANGVKKAFEFISATDISS